MGEEMSGIICSNCGRVVEISGAAGSYRKPYCKECFKTLWNDDNTAFLDWLNAPYPLKKTKGVFKTFWLWMKAVRRDGVTLKTKVHK